MDMNVHPTVRCGRIEVVGRPRIVVVAPARTVPARAMAMVPWVPVMPVVVPRMMMPLVMMAMVIPVTMTAVAVFTMPVMAAACRRRRGRQHQRCACCQCQHDLSQSASHVILSKRTTGSEHIFEREC